MIILIVYIISEPTKIEIELPHSRHSNMSSQHSMNSKFRPLVTEKYEKSLQKLAETHILEKNKALLQNQEITSNLKSKDVDRGYHKI